MYFGSFWPLISIFLSASRVFSLSIFLQLIIKYSPPFSLSKSWCSSQKAFPSALLTRRYDFIEFMWGSISLLEMQSRPSLEQLQFFPKTLHSHQLILTQLQLTSRMEYFSFCFSRVASMSFLVQASLNGGPNTAEQYTETNQSRLSRNIWSVTVRFSRCSRRLALTCSNCSEGSTMRKAKLGVSFCFLSQSRRGSRYFYLSIYSQLFLSFWQWIMFMQGHSQFCSFTRRVYSFKPLTISSQQVSRSQPCVRSPIFLLLRKLFTQLATLCHSLSSLASTVTPSSEQLTQISSLNSFSFMDLNRATLHIAASRELIYSFWRYFLIILIFMSVLELNSSAFPVGTRPLPQSQIHEIIASSSEAAKPVLRRCKDDDLSQLAKLQNEWFPFEYSAGFYARIRHGEANCILAETKIEGMMRIVGAIVYECTASRNLISGPSWYTNFFCLNDDSLYIMTLGVVDQFRRKGLAAELLSHVLKEAEEDESIRLVWLHVVDYNTPALRFYLKNGLQIFRNLTDFYSIKGKNYDANLLGKCFHGSQPRKGWGAWLTSILS